VNKLILHTAFFVCTPDFFFLVAAIFEAIFALT
jgi:hypothetical protein